MVRRGRSSRVVERGAITALAPVAALVPVWLLALAVLWLPMVWIWAVPFSAVAVGHLVLGGTFFLRPVQRVVLARLVGTRPPTADEWALLAPAWRQVAQASGIRPDRYVLVVVDADELNAFACGGHLLVVSSFAVHTLPRDELAGVLAHELSHHLGSHTVALTIGLWLSLPIVLLARMGFFLQNVAQAAAETLVRDRPALVAVGRVVAAILTGVSWVFLSALVASSAVANVVGRGAEYQADQRAISLGFGRELSRALRRVIGTEHPDRPTDLLGRLTASHPPARTRVARIDATLRGRRHPSMGWSRNDR
jgi:Zn-dependent protease with chaperone function